MTAQQVKDECKAIKDAALSNYKKTFGKDPDCSDGFIAVDTSSLESTSPALLLEPAGTGTVAAVVPASVAANENELASESLAAYVAAVMAPLSWLAVSIISFMPSAISTRLRISIPEPGSRSVRVTNIRGAPTIMWYSFPDSSSKC